MDTQSRWHDLELVDACPTCGSTGSSVVFTLPDALLPTSQLLVCRCIGCGFLYLNPRLSQAAVERLEDVNEFYAADVNQESTIHRLEEVCQFLETFCSHRVRLLDFGCNRGLMLEAASRRGWLVTGIELAESHSNRARHDFGHEVYKSLSEVPVDRAFDLITCWHVVEHVPNPLRCLQLLRQRLNDGGRLAIQVPSFSFVDAFERRSMISSLVCAVHNSYFTEETLRAVLDRAALGCNWVLNNPDDLMLTVICSKNRVG